MRNFNPWLLNTLIAAIVAGLLSGIPSTAWALTSGGDPWEATLAAGAVVLGPDASFLALLAAATVVHGGMSFFWAAVLCTFLPARRPVLWGLIAGALIAVLDILLIGRFLPAIRELAVLPQFADHLIFGVLVGAVVGYRDKRRRILRSPQTLDVGEM